MYNIRDNRDEELAEWETCDRSRRRFLQRAAIAGIGVATAPLLLASPAEAQIFRMASVSDQKKVGQQAAKQILQKYPEVHDSRATRFREMGERLVAALPESDRKTWDYNFRVIESKEVNAFALPGGPMFMYTGLYTILNIEDALAAVTGHEMTHVRLQHWAKANQKQQERQTLMVLGLSIFRAGRLAQSLAGLADNAITQGFSRTEEDQADAGGLQNMVAANYNPEGMIQLFQALEKVSGGGGGKLAAFLSDHPLTGDRIKHTKERIASLGANKQFPALTPLHL